MKVRCFSVNLTYLMGFYTKKSSIWSFPPKSHAYLMRRCQRSRREGSKNEVVQIQTYYIPIDAEFNADFKNVQVCTFKFNNKSVSCIFNEVSVIPGQISHPQEPKINSSNIRHYYISIDVEFNADFENPPYGDSLETCFSDLCITLQCIGFLTMIHNTVKYSCLLTK